MRGEVDDKLSIFNQKLDTAIDNFHVCLISSNPHASHPAQITENMRTEDALNQLLAAIKEGEDKHNILLSESFLSLSSHC
jgi:hypothetical protein